jgi:hypothetical protein
MVFVPMDPRMAADGKRGIPLVSPTIVVVQDADLVEKVDSADCLPGGTLKLQARGPLAPGWMALPEWRRGDSIGTPEKTSSPTSSTSPEDVESLPASVPPEDAECLPPRTPHLH